MCIGAFAFVLIRKQKIAHPKKGIASKRKVLSGMFRQSLALRWMMASMTFAACSFLMLGILISQFTFTQPSEQNGWECLISVKGFNTQKAINMLNTIQNKSSDEDSLSCEMIVDGEASVLSGNPDLSDMFLKLEVVDDGQFLQTGLPSKAIGLADQKAGSGEGSLVLATEAQIDSAEDFLAEMQKRTFDFSYTGIKPLENAFSENTEVYFVTDAAGLETLIGAKTEFGMTFRIRSLSRSALQTVETLLPDFSGQPITSFSFFDASAQIDNLKRAGDVYSLMLHCWQLLCALSTGIACFCLLKQILFAAKPEAQKLVRAGMDWKTIRMAAFYEACQSVGFSLLASGVIWLLLQVSFSWMQQTGFEWTELLLLCLMEVFWLAIAWLACSGFGRTQSKEIES